jgi:predicted transcriptional regulator
MPADTDLQAHPTDLRSLVARVVANYVTHNAVLPGDLPVLISTTADALLGLGKPSAPAIQEPRTPAVPIKRSVKPDSVTCLCCGYRGKMIRRHIQAAHGLTPDAYRTLWGLPPEYPLTSPIYAAQRAELARATGLGTKSGRRKSEPEPTAASTQKSRWKRAKE